MSHSTSILHLAVSGLLAIGLAAGASTATAADHDKEQCAGVIKAGKNDCATSKNACHSHVTTDADPEAWIYLPKGTCSKIAGARVVQVKDPTPDTKQ